MGRDTTHTYNHKDFLYFSPYFKLKIVTEYKFISTKETFRMKDLINFKKVSTMSCLRENFHMMN